MFCLTWASLWGQGKADVSLCPINQSPDASPLLMCAAGPSPTFYFGLGLSQPFLELLLEEEGLQSLLVMVDPVDIVSYVTGGPMAPR